MFKTGWPVQLLRLDFKGMNAVSIDRIHFREIFHRLLLQRRDPVSADFLRDIGKSLGSVYMIFNRKII
jgi:hypothetical protein